MLKTLEKKEKSLICINCPMGCRLTAVLEAGQVVSVTGNICKRGETYAQKECTNPTRIVTSTVRMQDGSMRMVPVKTDKDIPKDKIFDCMQALKEIVLKKPVAVGEVIVPHVCGLEANIVATRAVE